MLSFRAGASLVVVPYSHGIGARQGEKPQGMGEVDIYIYIHIHIYMSGPGGLTWEVLGPLLGRCCHANILTPSGVYALHVLGNFFTTHQAFALQRHFPELSRNTIRDDILAAGLIGFLPESMDIVVPKPLNLHHTCF